MQPGVRWAHLDIAGPGMCSEPRGHMPKGGTGFGARLLAELVAGSYEPAPAPAGGKPKGGFRRAACPY